MKLTRSMIYGLVAAPAVTIASYSGWAYSPTSTNAAVATTPGAFIDTKSGDEVERIQSIRIAAESGWPVVLVRDIGGNSPWWVQAACVSAEDRQFQVNAHFGNEQTAPGTRFELLVLTAKDAEAARTFEPGSTLEKLPDELPKSQTLDVVRK